MDDSKKRGKWFVIAQGLRAVNGLTDTLAELDSSVVFLVLGLLFVALI